MIEKKIKILISEKRIKNRIRRLAEKISKDYKNKKLALIIILKGAFIFSADLVRFLKLKPEIYFLKAKSYFKNKSSGKVKIYSFFDSKSLKNKNLLILEDIFDTGLTLKSIIKYLKKFKPKDIKIFCLLDKKVEKKEKNIKIDYLGFKIENKFVVGYGLDYNEKYRNLSYIGYLPLKGQDKNFSKK